MAGHIRDLVNIFPGQTAYILGSGPSLDDYSMFDIDQDNSFIIIINRVFGVCATQLMGKTFWMVQDDAWGRGISGEWDHWLESIRSGCGVYGVFMAMMYGKDNRRILAPDGPNIAHFETYEKGNTREILLSQTRGAVGHLGALYTMCGTACTSVHLAWLLGAKKIVLVGIDGGGGHADAVIEHYSEPSPANYEMAREQALYVAKKLKIEISDYRKG